MVAYSFRPQFVEPILTGLKRQTIRNERKRHARVGETVQLFTGMRTRSCRLIGTAKCLQVTNIRLDLDHGRIESRDTGFAWTTGEEIDFFAQQDGFGCWRELRKFWAKEHPGILLFSGVMIRWGGLSDA